MLVLAPAKVNLSLEVLGKRADGFHEIVSIMQTISIVDTLDIRPSDRLELQCSEPALECSDNLVLRAARALQTKDAGTRGCRIVLRKEIPIAAGLGGGSSDAAATLRALPRLWQLPRSETDQRRLAHDLGSDVPFFLRGGTALVQGRGERVRVIPGYHEQWYVLAGPHLHVSTATVYGAVRDGEWTDGRATRRVAARLDAGGGGGLGINGLEPALFRLYPEARTCYDAIRRVTSSATRVSGSGPTVFSLMSSVDEAQRAAWVMQKQGYWACTAHSLPENAE
ncbi:MAG: 4-(cytidine 5'-diphospho)-2-C-methyl-D-erythritol kinase [Chloroflexota bacterium]|nr:MAG: 4-(cytidine 5'-diphospho)-2-C-methyl-D-erythritol kinase [Chloroflexota bacterium]